MNHKIFAFGFVSGAGLLLLAFIAFAYFSPPAIEDTKRVFLEHGIYKTDISKEDCYLCGDNPTSPLAPYLGQANIGLFNLNTMECIAFELNRYDEDLNLISEIARYGIHTGRFGKSESKSIVDYRIDLNRGHLSFTAPFNKDSVLNISNMKFHFCTDCLSNILNQYTYDEDHWNMAIVYFEEKKIEPLQNDNVISTEQYDYRILFDYDKDNNKMRVNAFYCPLRYTALGYDENETVLEQIANYCELNGFAFSINDELAEYIGHFEKISEINSYKNSICFSESAMGKCLYIYKDGSYRFTDFDNLQRT